MPSIRIINRQDCSFALRIVSSDSEVFKLSVATLKKTIPNSQRYFDFRMRYWVISPEAGERLPGFLSLMQSLFNAEVEYTVETDQEREQREVKERASQQEREQAGDERTNNARGRRNRHDHLRIAPRLDVESAYATLYLTPGAPLEVIQAVYRTLAKLHHPDLGGSTELMAEINDAYNYLVELLKQSANVA